MKRKKQFFFYSPSHLCLNLHSAIINLINNQSFLTLQTSIFHHRLLFNLYIWSAEPPLSSSFFLPPPTVRYFRGVLALWPRCKFLRCPLPFLFYCLFHLPPSLPPISLFTYFATSLSLVVNVLTPPGFGPAESSLIGPRDIPAFLKSSGKLLTWCGIKMFCPLWLFPPISLPSLSLYLCPSFFFLISLSPCLCLFMKMRKYGAMVSGCSFYCQFLLNTFFLSLSLVKCFSFNSCRPIAPRGTKSDLWF